MKSQSTPSPVPVPSLQLVDREQLRASLKPGMTRASFSNWLFLAIHRSEFPRPVRVGRRAVAWSLAVVEAWLASRPRGGTFDGRRARGGQGAA